MDFVKFAEHGLNGLVIGCLFAIVWMIVHALLKLVSEIRKDHNEEREIWLGNYERQNKAMDEHNERARGFNEAVCEAHKYQREEHNKIMQNLQEIAITLGRINGYKDEHR